jgi:hypothetical protein
MVTLLCSKSPSSDDSSVVIVGRFLQPWIMLERLLNEFIRDGCSMGGDSFVAELVSAVLIVPNDLNSLCLDGVR